jgi:hypothetical protein
MGRMTGRIGRHAPRRFILKAASLAVAVDLAMILAIALPGPRAVADSQAETRSSQLAGLFVQSCIRFTGNTDGLRGWAMAASLIELPKAGEAVFLNGSPGKVFDATNDTGKYVVVSQDNGTCSAIAEAADGPALMTDMEQALRDAGIAVTLTDQQQDAQVKAIRHRSYAVSQGAQAWRVRASFLADRPGTAMLTASP